MNMPHPVCVRVCVCVCVCVCVWFIPCGVILGSGMSRDMTCSSLSFQLPLNIPEKYPDCEEVDTVYVMENDFENTTCQGFFSRKNIQDFLKLSLSFI